MGLPRLWGPEPAMLPKRCQLVNERDAIIHGQY
jgi:hypothetical protein